MLPVCHTCGSILARQNDGQLKVEIILCADTRFVTSLCHRFTKSARVVYGRNAQRALRVGACQRSHYIRGPGGYLLT